MEIDVKGLRRIRNYFGENDKTIFEHHAYAFLDRMIKDIENPTPDKAKMTGVELIALERDEQINKHGFDPKKYDQYYSNQELAKAAMFCLDNFNFHKCSSIDMRNIDMRNYPSNWHDWFVGNISAKRRRLNDKEFKIEMLQIAGAFCAAEIDRLQAINQQQEEQK